VGYDILPIEAEENSKRPVGRRNDDGCDCEKAARFGRRNGYRFLTYSMERNWKGQSRLGSALVIALYRS
jgi:predicted ATPase